MAHVTSAGVNRSIPHAPHHPQTLTVWTVILVVPLLATDGAVRVADQLSVDDRQLAHLRLLECIDLVILRRADVADHRLGRLHALLRIARDDHVQRFVAPNPVDALLPVAVRALSADDDLGVGACLQLAMRLAAGTQDLAHEVVGGVLVLGNVDFALILAVVECLRCEDPQQHVHEEKDSDSESPRLAPFAPCPRRGAYASHVCSFGYPNRRRREAEKENDWDLVKCAPLLPPRCLSGLSTPVRAHAAGSPALAPD